MRYIKSFANDSAIQAAVSSEELGHPYIALNDQTGKIDWNEKKGAPEPYGYISITSGNTYFNLGFKPNTIYSENNYLRLEVQNTFNSSYSSYLWATTDNRSGVYFSCEYSKGMYNGTTYSNLGSRTLLYKDKNDKLNGKKTFIYNNKVYTVIKSNGTSYSLNWANNFPTGNLVLFPSNPTYMSSFYYLKVFDSPEATEPLYYFYPIEKDGGICLCEAVNNNYIFPRSSSGIRFYKF